MTASSSADWQANRFDPPLADTANSAVGPRETPEISVEEPGRVPRSHLHGWPSAQRSPQPTLTCAAHRPLSNRFSTLAGPATLAPGRSALQSQSHPRPLPCRLAARQRLRAIGLSVAQVGARSMCRSPLRVASPRVVRLRLGPRLSTYQREAPLRDGSNRTSVRRDLVVISQAAYAASPGR
jgi:hypothetical protein